MAELGKTEMFSIMHWKSSWISIFQNLYDWAKQVVWKNTYLGEVLYTCLTLRQPLVRHSVWWKKSAISYSLRYFLIHLFSVSGKKIHSSKWVRILLSSIIQVVSFDNKDLYFSRHVSLEAVFRNIYSSRGRSIVSTVNYLR